MIVATRRGAALAIAANIVAASAWGQALPDAGQVLQEVLPRLLLPPTPPATLDLRPSEGVPPAAGGAQVTLQGVRLSGHSVFTEAELLSVLGEVKGEYDLSGLQALAAKLTAHYRANGYPFARALLPAQKLDGGVLEIQIVEGRYGQVKAEGERAGEAQVFLAPLQPGAVIASDALERATLILADQPGITISPILRPGQETGTGDLVVNVSREPLLAGDVGLDNHGNRYTGEYRARANIQLDSPFMLGDQIVLRALYSDEDLWLGSLSYSLPLGASGLRGSVGYSHTAYELGKDFKNLGATGTAKVTSLGLSYPLIRSQPRNLTLSATYQHKRLNDQQQLANTDDDKRSEVLPLTLAFDQRDGLLGGGITYGSLGYTIGRMKLDATLEAADIARGQNTRGGFDKWNLDIARVQTTPVQNLTLFGRLSSQWAGKNLDSSEGFGLGGANGVRAYPQGEGNGDEGWLVQLEARLRLGAVNPYLFYDHGRVSFNAENANLTTPANPNQREIAGAGLGVRYVQGPWNMDASLAWRTKGGAPQSDTKDRHPRLWVTAGYRF